MKNFSCVQRTRDFTLAGNEIFHTYQQQSWLLSVLTHPL